MPSRSTTTNASFVFPSSSTRHLACSSSWTFVAGKGRKPPMIAEPNAGVMLLVAAPARNVGAGGSAAKRVVLRKHATMPSRWRLMKVGSQNRSTEGSRWQVLQDTASPYAMPWYNAGCGRASRGGEPDCRPRRCPHDSLASGNRSAAETDPRSRSTFCVTPSRRLNNRNHQLAHHYNHETLHRSCRVAGPLVDGFRRRRPPAAAQGPERLLPLHPAEILDRVGAAEGVRAAADSGGGGALADADQDAAQRGHPRQDRLRRVHGREGLFRERSRLLRHGQPVPPEEHPGQACRA